MNKINITQENILVILKTIENSTSLSNAIFNLGWKHSTTQFSKLKKLLTDNGIDSDSLKLKYMDKFAKQRSPLANEQKLREAVQQSNSITEALHKMGFHGGGKHPETFKKYVNLYNISIEHFDYLLNGKTPNRNLIEIMNLFVANSSMSRSTIRNYILKYNLIPYQCASQCCNNKGTWFGVPLTLQLEHKNGINNDHRLSNLEFLCPNCHSITPTWGAKGRSPNPHHIPRIQKIIVRDKDKLLLKVQDFNNIDEILKFLKTSNSSKNYPVIEKFLKENSNHENVVKFFARIQNNSLQRKKLIKNPKEIFQELLELGTFEKVGALYDCTGKAIEKYLKRNNISCDFTTCQQLRKEQEIKRKINTTNMKPPIPKIEWPEGQAWCSCCKNFKLLNLFPPSKSTEKGRGYPCRECSTASRQKYKRNRQSKNLQINLNMEQ